MNQVIYAVLIALAAAHVFVAATATLVVLRDRTLEPIQTIFKIVVSWVFVYAGPLFILYVMNEHSPELLPGYARSGLLHAIFFGPIKPPPHGYHPVSNDAGQYRNSDASDIGIDGEGACGSGGD